MAREPLVLFGGTTWQEIQLYLDVHGLGKYNDDRRHPGHWSNTGGRHTPTSFHYVGRAQDYPPATEIHELFRPSVEACRVEEYLSPWGGHYRSGCGFTQRPGTIPRHSWGDNPHIHIAAKAVPTPDWVEFLRNYKSTTGADMPDRAVLRVAPGQEEVVSSYAGPYQGRQITVWVKVYAITPGDTVHVNVEVADKAGTRLVVPVIELKAYHRETAIRQLPAHDGQIRFVHKSGGVAGAEVITYQI